MSVDIKSDDEVQALLLLSSLPESWSGTVTAFSGSTGSTKLKLNNIRDLILREDIRLKKRLISVGQLDEEGYPPKGLTQLLGRILNLQKAVIGFCKPCVLGKQKKTDPATMLPLSMTLAGSHKVIRSRDVTFNKDSLYEAKAATDSSNLTNPNQKDQVVLEDSPDNLANKSIVTEHGLNSKITQSPVIEHPLRREALRLHSYEDPPESPRLRAEKYTFKELDQDVFQPDNVVDAEDYTHVVDKLKQGNEDVVFDNIDQENDNVVF
ncbi:hypothetical protein Tco_0686240 [Tanacetum coccineum]